MLRELKSKIKNKKLVLFGETHGTKEIPELLSKFFYELAKDEDFNLGLEIPGEFQNEKLDRVLSLAKEAGVSGLISGEYIKLIKEIPKNVNLFFIAPNSIKNQEDMERRISNNVLKLINDKKTFIILGSIHASKNKMEVDNMKIVPAGFLLYQKLKEKMFSILLKPKSGEFFNNGVKQVVSNEDNSFDKNFDYIYELDNVSPCSF